MTGVDAFAAVPGAVIDAGALRHLGNPLAEQRSLAAGDALVPLFSRSVITLTGPDRLSWLDSVSSQALTALAPGVSTETLILGPNGRIEHAVSVVDDGETSWLIAGVDSAAALDAWLRKMRFRLRVEIDAPEVSVIGGTPQAVSQLENLAVWTDPWPGVTGGGFGYAVSEPHPGSEFSWAEAIVTAETASALAARAVAGEQHLAGTLAAEALRIAAWRPSQATEVDDRALPHESDWMRTAVHLNKGCYRGQETVAKVHNLGHPPRRLVMLHLDGSESVLPERGAGVSVAGAAPVGSGAEADAVGAAAETDAGSPGAAGAGAAVEVGTVTSVAMHYELGPVALAVLRRNAPIDAELLVASEAGPIAATQEVIVPPEAGAQANVPRMPRLARRRR